MQFAAFLSFFLFLPLPTPRSPAASAVVGCLPTQTLWGTRWGRARPPFPGSGGRAVTPRGAAPPSSWSPCGGWGNWRPMRAKSPAPNAHPGSARTTGRVPSARVGSGSLRPSRSPAPRSILKHLSSFGNSLISSTELGHPSSCLSLSPSKLT